MNMDTKGKKCVSWRSGIDMASMAWVVLAFLMTLSSNDLLTMYHLITNLFINKLFTNLFFEGVYWLNLFRKKHINTLAQ
jgi:hypothetical protein